jgi:hypothetical protein
LKHSSTLNQNHRKLKDERKIQIIKSGTKIQTKYCFVMFDDDDVSFFGIFRLKFFKCLMR